MSSQGDSGTNKKGDEARDFIPRFSLPGRARRRRTCFPSLPFRLGLRSDSMPR